MTARRATCLGLVALVVTALVSSCTGGAGASGGAAGNAGMQRQAAGPAVKAAPTPSADRSVVRTATLTMRAADVPGAADRMSALAVRAGGRVDEDSRSGAPGHRTANLVLRVPAADLDALIERVDGVATETDRSVHGQDVTTVVADVDARVRALQTSVTRLRALLPRAATVSALLTVEKQLTARQGDLDAALARQRGQLDQVRLATLTVRLSQPPAPAPAIVRSSRGPAGFGSALTRGAHGLVLTVRWTLAGVGYLLPTALVLAVAAAAVLGVGRMRRRDRPRRT